MERSKQKLRHDQSIFSIKAKLLNAVILHFWKHNTGATPESSGGFPGIVAILVQLRGRDENN